MCSTKVRLCAVALPSPARVHFHFTREELCYLLLKTVRTKFTNNKAKKQDHTNRLRKRSLCCYPLSIAHSKRVFVCTQEDDPPFAPTTLPFMRANLFVHCRKKRCACAANDTVSGCFFVVASSPTQPNLRSASVDTHALFVVGCVSVSVVQLIFLPRCNTPNRLCGVPGRICIQTTFFPPHHTSSRTRTHDRFASLITLWAGHNTAIIERCARAFPSRTSRIRIRSGLLASLLFCDLLAGH